MGLGVVVGSHVLAAWGLVEGLARKEMVVIKEPVEAKIVQDSKPPPPPPPQNLPPPPTSLPPPPPFMPVPEVVVAPPTPRPTITTTPVPPPPAAPVIAPPSPPQAVAPAAVAPPAPPASAPVIVAPKVDFARDCEKPEYSREASAEQATGQTRLRVSVSAEGRVTHVEVLRSAGPTRAHKQLDRALVATVVRTCKFQPGTVDGRPQPLTREVMYVWKVD